MKLGFDNKRELAWMAGLVVVAVVLASRFFVADDPVSGAPKTATKASGAATGAVTPAPYSRGRKQIGVLRGLRPSLDPSLRFDLLQSSEEKKYEGGKRNIFREHVEEVKIAQPIVPVIRPQPPVDPGPPPPPPIPLKYYGFASKPGETRKVFLSNGDEVFIAEEGQVIQRRYKILKITPSAVEVEDVLNNHKQPIPLTQG